MGWLPPDRKTYPNGEVDPSWPIISTVGLFRIHRLEYRRPLFLDEMDVNFRKIDIDLYDEDALVETELYDADPRNPTQVVNDAKQKATAVRSALSK